MDMGSHDSNRARSMDRRKFLVLSSSAMAAGASALIVPRAGAQSVSFPTRPPTLVVTFSPGATADILARILASDLPTHLGQSVIVENKPGAGGSIGAAAVARAKNDGYTLLLGSNSTIAINPAIYHSFPDDPIKDFTPVIKVAGIGMLLLVPANSPVTSVQDLMRRMKERKKENSFQYNSAGTGSSPHLLGALLANLAGASAEHVPYQNIAQQFTALISGQVDFGFTGLPSSVSFVKSGRVRALGVTSAKPAPVLPDVPSLSSAGLDVFEKTDGWYGVFGPRDMPEAVTQTLHRAFVKTLGNPAIQAKLVGAGFDPVPLASSSEFARFVREQVAFWADLVKVSGAATG